MFILRSLCLCGSGEGDCGFVPGPGEEAGRQLHRVAGISGIQCSRRRYWIGSGFTVAGEAVSGLRKEVEVGIYHLSFSSGTCGVVPK